MVKESVAIKVLNEGLKTGADFCELYTQESLSHAVGLSYRRVDTVTSKLTYGAGVRLMQGTRVVYGYTSDLSEKSLVALAGKLAAALDGTRAITVESVKKVKNTVRHAPKKAYDSMSLADKIDYLKKGEAAIYEYSPLIVNASCTLAEVDETVQIFTARSSEARYVTDNRCHTRLVSIATAGKDGSFETAHKGPGAAKGLEILDEIDYAALSKSAAELAVNLLDAPECPSGKMPVVLGNGWGGVLFHEACGHPLEGTAISHGTSPFSGKLGQKIASDIVTAIDDGTIENAWGSENFDDEGEPSTKNVLIKDGILTSYMMDEQNGRRLNLKPTGSCRRQSYKFMPTTRMTNTYIAAGESKPEEIIAATKNGLYCKAFSGGSVDPSTDAFNFTACEAYLIKDGKIDKLVKSATLVGYGYEILPQIDMVGNDVELGSGMCGAASGMLFVSVGQPTIRVKEMTVGGRGGNN